MTYIGHCGTPRDSDCRRAGHDDNRMVAAQQHASVLSKVEISIVIVGLTPPSDLVFSFAAPISKRLGASGMGVVTRVMGLILATIAMSMLATSLKGLLPGLAG